VDDRESLQLNVEPAAMAGMEYACGLFRFQRIAE
jgi:hypothetical protein